MLSQTEATRDKILLW